MSGAPATGHSSDVALMAGFTRTCRPLTCAMRLLRGPGSARRGLEAPDRDPPKKLGRGVNGALSSRSLRTKARRVEFLEGTGAVALSRFSRRELAARLPPLPAP